MNCASLAAIGIHLTSWHSTPGYNAFNPGLYARAECGIQVGGYYNSERRFTAYASYLIERRDFPVFAAVGAATGYGPAVVPMATAGVRLGGFRLIYIPKLGNVNDTHVFHIAFERRF